MEANARQPPTCCGEHGSRVLILASMVSLLAGCISQGPRPEFLALGQPPHYWGRKCRQSMQMLPFNKSHKEHVLAVVVVPYYAGGRHRYLNAIVVKPMAAQKEKDAVYLWGKTESALVSRRAVDDLCMAGDGGGSSAFPSNWHLLCVFCGADRRLLGVAVLSQPEFAKIRDLEKTKSSKGRSLSTCLPEFWSLLTSSEPTGTGAETRTRR